MTLEQWEMARSQCWSMAYAAVITDVPVCAAAEEAYKAVSEWEKRFPKPERDYSK